MGSPLGHALAQWLATRPGPISAPTEQACWNAAHAASGLEGKVDANDFADGMARAGYAPRLRQCFGDKSNVEVWTIALPERQAGSMR